MWFMKIPLRSRVNECHGADSCHSSIREIRVKNVPEFAVKIPSRSRMARLNEFHECIYVNLCHHKIGDVNIRVIIEGGI